MTPPVRLLAAVLLVVSALVSDMATVRGASVGLATLGLAIVAVRPPWQPLVRGLGAGAVMLLPFFVFAPWSATDVPEGVLPGIASVVVPFRIFATGIVVLGVALTTMSSLSHSDLREALARLPLPRLLSAILLMVAFQVEALIREVGRIVLALRARGVSRRLRERVAIARGVPSSWLPRLLVRADRVGDAMVMRGFDGSPVRLRESHTSGWDWLIVMMGMVWLIAVVAVRSRLLG